MRRLDRVAFATEAGVSLEVVDGLVAVGALRSVDGTFDARDEAIVTTARSLVDAGVPLPDLLWALESGRFGLASIGRFFLDAGPRSEPTYAELAASLGATARILPAAYAAFGLPEPEPDAHPRAAEVDAILAFAQLWSLVDPSGESTVRTARLIGDATRRIAEGTLDVWDEVARPDATTEGAPTVGAQARPADPADPEQNISIVLADVARRIVALMHERQLEITLNARIISAIERVLGDAGRLPARTARPPAVAFVDLAGFTTLTEQRGDEEAARIAARLLELAEDAARRNGGRVVKQLGDGSLVRFTDAAAAVATVRELMPSVVAAGLPAAHAGIAAGPVIVRDGDVFGRTVNLAARLSALAVADEVLVEEGVVVALPAGTGTFEPLGRRALDGFAEPVAVWRLAGTRSTKRELEAETSA